MAQTDATVAQTHTPNTQCQRFSVDTTFRGLLLLGKGGGDAEKDDKHL
jgi:hypothetical protein